MADSRLLAASRPKSSSDAVYQRFHKRIECRGVRLIHEHLDQRFAIHLTNKMQHGPFGHGLGVQHGQHDRQLFVTEHALDAVFDRIVDQLKLTCPLDGMFLGDLGAHGGKRGSSWVTWKLRRIVGRFAGKWSIEMTIDKGPK